MKQEDIFNKTYTTQRALIDKKLASLLHGKKPVSLYEPCTYILSNPGKRLRPFLILISAKAAGSSYKNVYNAALAIEMLHTFTLAHDDIMDKADKRRGHLTLHKKYDLNTAILAGDSLLSVAYQYLLKDTGDNAKEVIGLFTRSLIEVCEGQSFDTDFEIQASVTLDEYLLMITKKTAIMLETCCAIGSVLGGAPENVVQGLAKFGKNLGIAFQIQDDLLDIIGNEKEFGKTIGGDLVAGKKTFLFLKALEKAQGQDKTELLRVIETKGIKKSQVPAYRDLYYRLGVIEDAQNAIAAYTKKALGSLKVLTSEEDRAMFTWLANKLIKRTR
ncbi:MAG: polyprenyl synthetase family protein [Ignavibacteria bacterium]|nr:polyprenyl synthetase family protein [Ignavibacteria bacterium]